MSHVKKRATEQEYLHWFYCAADFGPSEDDVRYVMEQNFIFEHNLLPPHGYYCCEQCGKDKEDECKCQQI